MIAARHYFSVQAGLRRQRGSSLPARTDSVVDPEPERISWLVSVRGDWWLRDSATATTTDIAASACDRLLGWLSQGVAAPPNGLDVILTAAGVSELLSELAYEDVDDLGVRFVVQSAVKMVEEHFLGQSRASAEGQE